MGKLDDDKLAAAKDKIMGEFKDSEMVVGAILTDKGVRGYQIGGAGAMQLVHAAYVLRELSDKMLGLISEHLGEAELQGMWGHMERHFKEDLKVIADETEVTKRGE